MLLTLMNPRNATRSLPFSLLTHSLTHTSSSAAVGVLSCFAGAWEEENDWEDDNLTFTSRTDVSDISSASGNYRWALFTPTVPMVRRRR